jgi:hypothetical protein
MGHVKNLADHTVKIPLLSLSNNENGNVVTNLTLTASTGAFAESKAYIGSLSITGFTHSYSGATLLSNTDSLNTALASLEKAILDEIDSRKTAIQNLDKTAVSAGTGQIIATVSQEDGIVSASVRDLLVEDIPQLTVEKLPDNIPLSKIDTTGTMASESVENYLTKEEIENTYQPIEGLGTIVSKDIEDFIASDAVFDYSEFEDFEDNESENLENDESENLNDDESNNLEDSDSDNPENNEPKTTIEWLFKKVYSLEQRIQELELKLSTEEEVEETEEE